MSTFIAVSSKPPRCGASSVSHHIGTCPMGQDAICVGLQHTVLVQCGNVQESDLTLL